MTIPKWPRILALAPQGKRGIGVVASACRASALGVIDLRADRDGDLVVMLERLARLTASPFGVRTTVRQAHELGRCARNDRGLDAVCIPVGHDPSADFEAAVRFQRDCGRTVIAEATTRDEARRAIEAGASGLIVAGHEAGECGGAESSFVLMQGVLAFATVPVWVRGGIGLDVAAGCVAAGAAGVVLDGALLLARESPLDSEWREQIARWDGSESTVVAMASGAGFRVFARPGVSALVRLRLAAARGGATGRLRLPRRSAGTRASAFQWARTRRSRKSSPADSSP